MKILYMFGTGIVLFLATTVYSQKVEAEDGQLSGTVISTTTSGYSGSGYVTGFDQDGDAVTITVTVSSEGLYHLAVGYAAPYGEKTNDIYVNGAFAGSQIFTERHTFGESPFGKIYLNAGDNEIKIVKNWGYFEVDYFTVQPALPNEIHHYSEALINENATPEANILYRYLRDLYGHRILSGQQAYNGESLEFDFLLEKTGKLPAIKGFDLIDYSPSRVERGTSSQESERSIEWWGQGGIVSMTWHWNAPKGLLDSDDAPWWSGFYTDATTFDPSIAMNDSTSEEYELIIRDIDVIAGELKKMQEANVPLLWRPLHEAEGGWFWWGSKGPETCVWLWKLMYDRLTGHHGLNNLIWVWTGTNSSVALDWYPGDDYVDIVGADIYLSDKDYSPSFSLFDALAGIHEGKKIVTMSETGTLPHPDELDARKARWSWFCTWNGDFILDGVTNELGHIIEVYNHEYVITFDELPDFYNYVSPEFPDDDEEVLRVLALQGASANVFPNPTSDHLFVRLDRPDQVTAVALYNLRGELLMELDTHEISSKMTMDLRGLEPGIYIVRLATAGHADHFRVRKD